MRVRLGGPALYRCENGVPVPPGREGSRARPAGPALGLQEHLKLKIGRAECESLHEELYEGDCRFVEQMLGVTLDEWRAQRRY